MSAVDFLVSGSRPTCSSNDVRSGIIGTFLACARQAPTCSSTITWGNRRRVPLMGPRAWWHRAISNAIADAGRAAGVEIRSQRRCARHGSFQHATGIVLKNGDELSASVVVSSVDPRLTFTA